MGRRRCYNFVLNESRIFQTTSLKLSMNLRSHKTLCMACFFLSHGLSRFTPNSSSRRKLSEKIARVQDNLTQPKARRVASYNQLNAPFTLTDPITYQSFSHRGKSIFKIDLHRILKHFPTNLPFRYHFGDRFSVPDQPKFIKARPTQGDSTNSVVMRFNSLRHFFST